MPRSIAWAPKYQLTERVIVTPLRTGLDVLEYEIRQEQARQSADLPGTCGMRSTRWTPLIGERVAAKRQPIAATRNERVSSMLPLTPFGISSFNGNAVAFARRSRSSRTTPYRWRCARRWERFGLAS